MNEKPKWEIELDDIANECKQKDWDGYGATPVHIDTIATVAEFMRLLPANVTMPEFCAEPDGAISIDWFLDNSNMLSLSIGGSHTPHNIAFVWKLKGGHLLCGSKEFNGKEIPPTILQLIQDKTTNDEP